MIITSRLDSTLQVVNVDITPRNASHHFEADVEMSTEDDFSVQLQAGLRIADSNPGPNTFPNRNPEANDMEVVYDPRKRLFQQVRCPGGSCYEAD